MTNSGIEAALCQKIVWPSKTGKLGLPGFTGVVSCTTYRQLNEKSRIQNRLLWHEESPPDLETIVSGSCTGRGSLRDFFHFDESVQKYTCLLPAGHCFPEDMTSTETWKFLNFRCFYGYRGWIFWRSNTHQFPHVHRWWLGYSASHITSTSNGWSHVIVILKFRERPHTIPGGRARWWVLPQHKPLE